MEVMETMGRLKLEQSEGWRSIVNDIPYLNFPKSWQVKMVPPYHGAVCRFHVKHKDKEISVYLDWFENLGYYDGKPYWEIYPVKGDTQRFDLKDTAGIIDAIKKEFRRN